MGGHGGLNILPQKKWNVYNYKNRVQVQKDKHNANQKKQERSRQMQNGKNTNLINRIKMENSNIELRKEVKLKCHSDDQESKSQKQKSNLMNEFEKIQQKNSNINFFKEQEKYIDQKQKNRNQKLQQIAKQTKQNSYNYSSHYFQANNKTDPWYKKINKSKQYNNFLYQQIKTFNQSQNKQQYYKILHQKQKKAQRQRTIIKQNQNSRRQKIKKLRQQKQQRQFLAKQKIKMLHKTKK